MARFKRVPVNQIKVDDRYQRAIMPARVKRIVDNFDPRQLGVLEVSQRNGAGSFAVFDGQHRLAALKKLGLADAPCLVHKLKPEEEAELFVRLQMDRKPTTPVERFRAQLFYGHPQANEINEIVEDEGFSVVDSASPTNIRAITAVEGVYNREGADQLREALNMIQSVWGGDDRATDGYFIAGTAEFIRGYRDRIGPQERSKLRAIAPVVILRRALGPTAGGGAMVQRFAVAAELRKVSGVRGRPAGPTPKRRKSRAKAAV